jgi:hypothetical protein
VNIDSAFPSTYLKASDIGDSQPVVTIDRVEIEPVGKQKEMKPIVYFRGKEKGLVLNKTNAKKISEITGEKDTDNWAGCQIRLYGTETSFDGDMVECIRVKAPATAPKPKPAPEPVASDPDDPIPF